ncbi:hypothetical protein HYX70_04940 [Candidatus Saccharibacteria bacterium]|nr:hypothetical protein [Candidatus Saccharibacteria bacterium]
MAVKNRKDRSLTPKPAQRNGWRVATWVLAAAALVLLFVVFVQQGQINNLKADNQKLANGFKSGAGSYLNIPEKGIKLQLSPTIRDAYYFIDSSGNVSFSTRTLNAIKIPQCKAQAVVEGSSNKLSGAALLGTAQQGFKGAQKVGAVYYSIQPNADCKSDDPNVQTVIKSIQDALFYAGGTIAPSN